MTGRAIGHSFDLVFLDEAAPKRKLVFFRFPLHVEDVLARADELLRRPVAFQAPLHVEGVYLPHQGHLIHLAVTGYASDALPDVDAVIEIGEIRKVVHSRPLQRLPGPEVSLTGSNIGLSVQIWEWQLIQVSIGGISANAAVSTLAWQYRQSMPKPFTWCL